MKRFSVRRWIGVALMSVGVVGNAAGAAATTADAAFETLAAECIESLLEARPETATQLGDHRYDDRLTDYSAEALAARVAALRA